MSWRLIKTLIFTLVAPGTVALYVPGMLRERSADHAMHSFSLYPWLALFLCGAGIYFWCAWDFAVKGMGTPAPIDAPRLLVVQGLYRFTRNPMYVGVLAMIFAQAIYYGSRPVALYGCALFLGFHLFVRLYEEPTLRRLFGTQYEQYCHRVPRWFLRLG